MSIDPASERFNCTDRERAVFELGIKMGAAFHQYLGIPLSSANVAIMEKAIEDSLKVQAFVRDAKVRISRRGIGQKNGPYQYTTLGPEGLALEVEVKYGCVTAKGGMEFDPDLDYPIMYVTEVSEE